MGGGETHLVNLAAGLRRRGHDVYVAHSTNSPLRQALLNALPQEKLIPMPLRNALDIPGARKLAAIVKERQIELVHAHLARDYPPAAYAVKRGRDARLVLTRHVLFPMSRLHSVVLANVSRVIAVSDAVARALAAQRVFPAAKIVVVRNGIDVDRFAANRQGFDRSRFCRAQGIPEDRPLVGTVGEITRLKGHEDFVRAAAAVRTRIPNAHFIIAGQDQSPNQAAEKSLQHLIGELGVSDCVQRFGWLDNLADLYCALDLFVSASHTESFGLAMVEAMASATAVIATATEGAGEIIEDGLSGKLTPIADAQALANAVINLLRDDATRGQIAKAGALRAKEEFSLERMIAQTEQVYRSAIKTDENGS